MLDLLSLQVNIWKIIYLNYRERYEDMIDHHNNKNNLSSRESKAWKKFRPEQDLNPWPLWYQCSVLPNELSSHLGAGHNVSS